MNATANVLIVDDEEVVRRSYATTLAAAQCRASAACDGEEALQAMELMLCTWSGWFFSIAKRVLRMITSESWFTWAAAASSSSLRSWRTASTAKMRSVAWRR